MEQEARGVSLNRPTESWNEINLATRVWIIASLAAGAAGPIGFIYWRMFRINSTLSGMETQVGQMETNSVLINEHIDRLQTNVDRIATQVYAKQTQEAKSVATPTP